MIEEGPHLWNGMVYIDLNMVRAGVVAHPAQWPWCSYSEWMGQRRRYGVIDTKECLRILGGATLEEFRAVGRGSPTEVRRTHGSRLRRKNDRVKIVCKTVQRPLDCPQTPQPQCLTQVRPQRHVASRM